MIIYISMMKLLSVVSKPFFFRNKKLINKIFVIDLWCFNRKSSITGLCRSNLTAEL